MVIEIGLIPGTVEANINTHYAPLALLSAHYQQNQTLKPLEMVDVAMKTVRYSPTSKLEQVFLSILAGCEYLSEINCRLKSEQALAQVWQLEHFADQSMLSRTLDELTQMNIEQLRTAETTIWQQNSQTKQHDWRGYLLLDYDLSGLPSGKGAEGSTKGYFSGKKTQPGDNWHG
jgi:hypothetical protein